MQDVMYNVLIPMQVPYIAWLSTALRYPSDKFRQATPAEGDCWCVFLLSVDVVL